MVSLGCLALCVQVVLWVRTILVGDEMNTEWVGLNRLAHYFHDLPIGVLLALVGFGLIQVGIRLLTD
jgi:hypothetical protein